MRNEFKFTIPITATAQESLLRYLRIIWIDRSSNPVRQVLIGLTCDSVLPNFSYRSQTPVQLPRKVILQMISCSRIVPTSPSCSIQSSFHGFILYPCFYMGFFLAFPVGVVSPAPATIAFPGWEEQIPTWDFKYPTSILPQCNEVDSAFHVLHYMRNWDGTHLGNRMTQDSVTMRKEFPLNLFSFRNDPILPEPVRNLLSSASRR
ncbi:hypothetical protein BS78_K234000 [Paspalum vaginatum]|uniref:Uncharacterized protein n=1 Tax=Paspalum vaginatum TaxID=158149 RepID=A0A9W8CGN3_9POAL|nr:hypothetical protein BS78_K234000 [Paspalum vaginatum]